MPASEMVGGSPMMVKKTGDKEKVLGRLRCIYLDCKRHKLVKVKGQYIRLTEARARSAK